MSTKSDIYFIVEYIFKDNEGYHDRGSLYVEPKELGVYGRTNVLEAVTEHIKNVKNLNPLTTRIKMCEYHHTFYGVHEDGMEVWSTRQNTSIVQEMVNEIRDKYISDQKYLIGEGISSGTSVR